MERLSRWAPLMLGILRIMTGLLFFEHGSSKLVGFPPFGPGGSPLQQPPLFSFLGWSGILEFFGGGLFIPGFCTRPVAFLLSGEMAVGYFYAHAPRGIFPMANLGEMAVLFTFVFLYFVFAGAGTLSVDGMLERRRAAKAAG